MPAPLSIPAIRNVRPPRLKVRARSLGKVSVVIKPFAARSQAAKSEPRLEGTRDEIPERILEMGRFWPITPVDITNVSWISLLASDLALSGRRASVALTMAQASSKPCLPVTALAHPL